ncbi:MAG: putative zinc-binding protein [Gemmatales bacterium]
MRQSLPIVFACAGCSNAGKVAYELGRTLSERGIAEMSCLAGIGAAKPLFLKKLQDREVWIIDGCPIECSQGVFAQINESVDIHIRLHDLGVRKNEAVPDTEGFEKVVSAALEQVEQQRQQRLLQAEAEKGLPPESKSPCAA